MEERFKILDATAFWREIVVKDYSEWADDKTNLRLGFHAAMALLHMTDWAPEDKEALAKNCAAFGYLRSIAEASKHRDLDRSWRKISGVASVAVKSSDNPRPSLPFQGGTLEISGGRRHLGHDARIVVLGLDGVERDFADILQEVFEMWRKIVAQRGIE